MWTNVVAFMCNPGKK